MKPRFIFVLPCRFIFRWRGLLRLAFSGFGFAPEPNAAGGLLKNISLGPLGNTIAGAAGGGVGGSILSGLIPALGSAASAAGGFDIGALAGQLAGGGITGAVVTAVVGLIKNALIKKA